MKTKLLAFAFFGLLPSFLLLSPTDARACGGCFHAERPSATQSPSVVTDHRMVLAITPTMTTLWDQIEYAGDPEEFAWVLPIRGKVVVGLGSDSFISGLDEQTAPIVRAPWRSCGPTWGFSDSSSGGGCGSSSSMEATSASPPMNENGGLGWQEDSGVFVTDRSVVGPYETVQVHGSDAGGIIGWLRANHYVVPVELEPMLSKYVTEGFDFVAVKLRPGLGVHAMRPIRVSFRGAYPSLPLRMVRAGVGDKVGIKLFVIGDGRWKTGNFATLAIDPGMLTWDFAAQRSDYTTVRDAEAQKLEGRAFVIESSVPVLRTQLPPPEPIPAYPEADSGAPHDSAPADSSDAAVDSDDDADPDADPDAASDAESGGDAATDTAPPPPPDYDAGAAPNVDPLASDLEVAYGTFSSRRVTRLRAELPSKYLDVDLVLEADDNQSQLRRELQVQRAVNENCPAQTEARSSSNDGCDCAVPETRSAFGAPASVCAAALGVALVRRRRRK